MEKEKFLFCIIAFSNNYLDRARSCYKVLMLTSMVRVSNTSTTGTTSTATSSTTSSSLPALALAV